MTNPNLVDVNYIKIMTDAFKKNKYVPKHKEMISDSMFHYIAKLALRSAKDSLIRAMVDWIVLGCYTGF